MNQPHILILGASGMLGHKMFQRLSERFAYVSGAMRIDPTAYEFEKIELLQPPRVYAGIDATSWTSCERFLRRLQPDVIVNCIGIIKQRPAAQDSIPSISINSLFPHKLAELARQWGGRVIHFSTDCVFSGRQGQYREDDPSDAEDLYGRTKFLGEVSVSNALTLRTSIIGRELTQFRSLLEWFLSQHGKVVQGYQRTMYSGVTTNHLADLVGHLIESHPRLHGLFQVASDPISKYDLLCLIRDAFKVEVEIRPVEGELCDRTMMSDKLMAAIGYRCPGWPELILQLSNDPTPYEEWRTSHHAITQSV